MTMQEQLIKLKPKLKRGDQREIARRTGIHPNTVSLAFQGFVKDEKQCKLILETAKTILHA